MAQHKTDFQRTFSILLEQSGRGSIKISFPKELARKLIRREIRCAVQLSTVRDDLGLSVPGKWVFPSRFQLIQAGADRGAPGSSFDCELPGADDFADINQRQVAEAFV
ncbi:hypothetical protein Pan161_23700 [Gimesia algae]|uniref:Uncharacterized protein n=1 Tax=Gimesia algae TaxID=2527971 RepID=A0A517VCJ0_9PLAN|nr:hypothetical protein Pan161_23700 [Gimesia algae]